ncbi:MAG: FAD-dependent oxidoreductase [Planctomycetes bacterium]|nr:FAD-dependent oxidoreductase [Planctomycetota bacterium]
MNEGNPAVLVVGAGPAGLAAADRLTREGVAVQVLESREELAGRAGQIELEGYRFDRGAEFFTSFYPTTRRLVREKGLEPDVVEIKGPGKLFVDGRLVPMVTGPLSALTTPLLSIKSKLRLRRLSMSLLAHAGGLDFSDPRSLAAADDESAEEYGREVLGDEFVERVMKPGLESLTLSPASETSKALFLSQALVGPTARFYSIAGGMGRLCESLARGLPVRLRTKALAVREAAGGVEVDVEEDSRRETLRAEAAILAVQAPAAAAILGANGSPELAAFLGRVRYTPAVKLDLGLDRPLGADCPGVIPVGSEFEGLAGLQFLAYKGTRQVPEGKDGLGIVTGGRLAARLLGEDEESVTRELADLAARVLAKPIPGVVCRHVTRLSEAVPQFPPGRYRELAKLDPSIGRRIFLAGDYLAGPSIEAALRTGIAAAERALAAIR